MPKVRALRNLLNSDTYVLIGGEIELSKLDAERLVGFGAAEYVQDPQPVEVKEEKQPEKSTKEDKTANKRTTK